MYTLELWGFLLCFDIGLWIVLGRADTGPFCNHA
ncbi:hypothetical protein CGRA01v4_10376 [Colletotrichum graminicola]|nr:hypothetical protein CGRA01v4_10376 [Colletotrichum graminicola]